MLDSLLKTKSALLFFIIITTLYGWCIKFWWKKTVSKYNPLIIVIVEIMIAFLLLLGFIILTKKEEHIQKELANILMQDYIYLSIIGLVGLFTTYLGTTLYLHHNVEDMEMNEFLITLLINTVVIYLFTNKKMTLSVFVGLCLVSIGGYLIVK
tara:strand:- start:1772 stop:2230 length:459 start_codon:yes stop_codon:yes gene_type:complete